MINENVEQAMNKQINAELYSAYLYQSMAAYFESEDLDGFSAWMKVQAMEETTHAQKFFDFINERGGRVKLTAIEAPKTDWNSPLEAFQDAYEHETKVTALIDDLVKTAREANDNASEIFLQWFVTEQVEEEASADEVVQKLKWVQDSPHAVYMLNQELGNRTFTSGADEGE
ncbi:MAG: ferritin [Phycisphaerae bacterium]